MLLAACHRHEVDLRTDSVAARSPHGNALLTTRDFGAVRRYDLTVDGREPRGALDVELHAAGAQVVRVIVTHLGLRPAERRAQVRKLLTVLRGIPADYRSSCSATSTNGCPRPPAALAAWTAGQGPVGGARSLCGRRCWRSIASGAGPAVRCCVEVHAVLTRARLPITFRSRR